MAFAIVNDGEARLGGVSLVYRRCYDARLHPNYG